MAVGFTIFNNTNYVLQIDNITTYDGNSGCPCLGGCNSTNNNPV